MATYTTVYAPLETENFIDARPIILLCWRLSKKAQNYSDREDFLDKCTKDKKFLLHVLNTIRADIKKVLKV